MPATTAPIPQTAWEGREQLYEDGRSAVMYTLFVFSIFYARKFIFCSVIFCRRVVFVKCFTLDVVLVRRCISRFTVDQVVTMCSCLITVLDVELRLLTD